MYIYIYIYIMDLYFICFVLFFTEHLQWLPLILLPKCRIKLKFVTKNEQYQQDTTLIEIQD